MHVTILLLLLVVIGLLLLPYLQRRYFSPSANGARDAPTAPTESKQFPEAIAWLLDAPLFIDEDRVEAFYDAVLRPDFEQASLTLSKSVKEGATIGADLKITSGIPWISEGEAGISSEITAEQERAAEVGITRVVNPYRHLLALSLHYADRLPERLVLGAADGIFTDGNDKALEDAWTTPEFLVKTPRVLAMLDLPSETEFIPTALELKELPRSCYLKTSEGRWRPLGASHRPTRIRLELG